MESIYKNILRSVSIIILNILFFNVLTLVMFIIDIYSWIVYFIIKRAINNFDIERKIFGQNGYINQKIKVIIRVKNNSNFNFNKIKIIDLTNIECISIESNENEKTISLDKGETKKLVFYLKFNSSGTFHSKNVLVVINHFLLLNKIKKRYYNPFKINIFYSKKRVHRFPIIPRTFQPIVETKSKFLEDSNHINGVSEYTAKESLKRIHWKASAHAGELLVKNYNYTAGTRLHLFFNSETKEKNNINFKKLNKKYLDISCNILSSIGNEIMEQNIDFSFYSQCISRKLYENLKYDDIYKFLKDVSEMKLNKTDLEFSELIEKKLYNLNYSDNITILTKDIDDNIIKSILLASKKVSNLNLFLLPLRGFHEMLPIEYEKFANRLAVLNEEHVTVKTFDPNNGYVTMLNFEN